MKNVGVVLASSLSLLWYLTHELDQYLAWESQDLNLFQGLSGTAVWEYVNHKDKQLGTTSKTFLTMQILLSIVISEYLYETSGKCDFVIQTESSS